MEEIRVFFQDDSSDIKKPAGSHIFFYGLVNASAARARHTDYTGWIVPSRFPR